MKTKKMMVIFLFVGLLVVAIHSQFKRMSDSGLCLVGTLVLRGDEGVKDCVVWKNGIKHTLDQDQIKAVFNFGSSTFAFINQGANGVGHEFPIEFHLVNGVNVETMIDYEPTKHIVTLDVYGGFGKDVEFLSTKLTDQHQIELVGSLLSTAP
jgi:hypothetical protein